MFLLSLLRPLIVALHIGKGRMPPATTRQNLNSSPMSRLLSTTGGGAGTVVNEGSSSYKVIAKYRVAGGGWYHRIQHDSTSTQTPMIFGLFLPSSHSLSESGAAVPATSTPAMFWLSGLTCDDTNFAMKAGPMAFAAAEEEQIAVVIPDTSPRGDDVPGHPDPDDSEAWSFGKGAGYYVDATEEPYNKNYQMYTYITKELPKFVQDQFQVGYIKSISGQ